MHSVQRILCTLPVFAPRCEKYNGKSCTTSLGGCNYQLDYPFNFIEWLLVIKKYNMTISTDIATNPLSHLNIWGEYEKYMNGFKP